MQITFKKLMTYMEKEKAHSYIKNRNSAYSIPDMMEKGINILTTRGVRGQVEVDSENMDVDGLEWEALVDEMEEVEDDGSLDL
jgi:hypothetical protein